jgi:hypothetical protein
MHIYNSYKELIDFAKSQTRSRQDGNYYEKHHILPRCMGGTNDESNLILLTLGEHLQAHYLLAIENKDNKFYGKMLDSCIVIIHPKNYIKKGKEDAVRELLNDDEAIHYYESIKKETIEYRKNIPGPNKGKTFTFNRTWVQFGNQKPVAAGDKRLQKMLNDGATIIKDCPICHKENSRESYCCCEEHLQQYEQIRRENVKKVQGINSAKIWATSDNTERIQKIKNAHTGPEIGERIWVNNGKETYNISTSELDNYKSKGFIEGRLMPRIVEYRWHR